MPLRFIAQQIWHYALITIMLGGSWLLSERFTGSVSTTFEAASHTETLVTLFSIVIVCAMGFVIVELAKPTVLPSFVLAIFFGIVSRDTLSHLVENSAALTTLITIGAIMILFGGGLETPFTKFKRLISPILSLAFIGTVINALLLSLILMSLVDSTGIDMPLAAIVLLGAAVASTDPAAIIPCFQCLHFRRPRVKHIAISESAINDVVGVVMVTIFLTIFQSNLKPISVLQSYALLGTREHLTLIIKVLLGGIFVGMIGFAILHFWSNWKQKVQTEDDADAALFLAVPLFTFTLAEAFGGSGYLAVFLTGLLFHIRSHFRHVEHYFNHTIEGFMKPTIFMLLGAMVNPVDLITYAEIGLISGLLFTFVLRPLIVLITLTPFHFTRLKLSWKEIAFLSFVRETGVIPAVLLITISLSGIPGAEASLAVGLWIILITLVIEPPLTPLIARKLGIATDKPALPERSHIGPVAVLCSRGYSFPERMKTVVDWSIQHSVDNIALLHCPEEKYNKQFVRDVEKRANDLFKSVNKQLEADGRKPITFEFLCGPGLLQENIESLIAEGDVSIIFVGSKMLDYRLEDVKRLNVPFYFMS